jgi:hypothetical protein
MKSAAPNKLGYRHTRRSRAARIFNAGVSPMKSTSKTKTRKRKWSREIKTVSTFPPPGSFTKSAEEVARIMESKKVSPGGIGSAIRMVQMFINRAGKKLSPERKRELEKAKRILQRKLRGDSTKS